MTWPCRQVAFFKYLIEQQAPSLGAQLIPADRRCMHDQTIRPLYTGGSQRIAGFPQQGISALVAVRFVQFTKTVDFHPQQQATGMPLGAALLNQLVRGSVLT